MGRKVWRKGYCFQYRREDLLQDLNSALPFTIVDGIIDRNNQAILFRP